MDPFVLLTPLPEEPAPLALDAVAFAHLPAMQALSGVSAVAVALSGGPDSMALAALTQEWAQERGIAVHMITVDHALRPESATEALRVGDWVGQHLSGVTHRVLRRDAALITPTKLQEQARHDRYRLMADECRARGIAHLLLAHHQDDQAETFLFRLCKGSGLDGLAGMNSQSAMHIDPKKGVTLVRPLLGVDKGRLVATCQARALPFVSDPSNTNDKFARVRLRRVMSALGREGLTVRRLAVTALRLGRARAALEYYAEAAWVDAVVSQSDCDVLFDLTKLSAVPEDIRVRVLARALAQVGGDQGYGPRLEQVEELGAVLFEQAGFTRTTLHHCLVENSSARKTLRITREKP